jgi:putative drug exporter of the RND superfamily
VVPGIDGDLGTDILVTGPVAANIDFSDYLAERIWYFYGAVLAISFLFLMACSARCSCPSRRSP